MKTPDVYEGMHISMLLLRMPKELWVKEPTIKLDTEWPGKLIVTYHYPKHDIILAWAEHHNAAGELRMQGYFIQTIWEIENVD